MVYKNKTLSIIIILTLFSILIPFSVESSIDVAVVYGYVEFNNGVAIPNGITVTLTDNDTGHYKIVSTYVGGVYTASVHGSNGDTLWVNVSFAGNSGGSQISLDMDSPSQRCDVTISGNEIPIPDFSYSPTEPTNADVITFTDNSSDPEDITINSWNWDFGDSTSSTIQNPIHRYLSTGVYTVTLTVYDQQGAPNSTSSDITITTAPNNNGGGPVIITNSPPTAVINASKKGYVNQTITFNANQSYDTDGTITSYSWEVGDSTTSSEIIFTHMFTKTGNYSVKLSVNDEYDDEDNVESYILIEEIPFKIMSTNTLSEINTKYDTNLVERCYSNDTNNDGILDNFTDPNKELVLINTTFIDNKPVFILTIDNDSIPDFFWNPDTDTITSIQYQKIDLNSKAIDAENNTITYNISLDTNNWSYIKIQNKHPKYSYEIKNPKNQTINDDKIWGKKDSIIFFDNRSDIYQIIYHYTILQPETKIVNQTKIQNPKTTFIFTYNEAVKIINSTLNNKTISLETNDNKTYKYIPNKNLTDGTYKFVITVEDSDNNTLISVYSYSYSGKKSEEKVSEEKNNIDIPTIPIMLILIVIVLLSLIFVKKTKKLKKEDKEEKSKDKTKK